MSVPSSAAIFLGAADLYTCAYMCINLYGSDSPERKQCCKDTVLLQGFYPNYTQY